MHLRKSSEYLYRIITTIASSKDGTMNIGALAAGTCIPPAILRRLCLALVDHNFLETVKIDNIAGYHALPALFSMSLYDIIMLTDGNTDLFALYDKKSPAYSNCRAAFEDVQAQMIRILRETKIVNDPHL